jgi:ABC-type cobalamin/Fe3+-siderophores transport system ATPase subunit/ABC-type Fe3+-siderophore transport system permease subunit
MRLRFWILAPLTLVVVAMIGVVLGPVSLSPAAVWSGLLGHTDPTAVAIVRSVRLPRVVLAACVGAALGMSGAAMQGTLRNALAEPYLLGVSGGAAVGAVIAVAAGATTAIVVPLAAFGGAVAATAVVIGVARAAGRGRADVRLLLMAGVVVGAFANAAIMIAYAIAPPETVRGALWWMMGSVDAADWNRVGWLALYVIIGGGALLTWGREIDALALGDEAAAGLGVDVQRAGRRAFLAAGLLAAASVAAAGLVGFVGLVVPHIVRGAGLHRHRALIAGAAVVGGALVVGADVVARIARAGRAAARSSHGASRRALFPLAATARRSVLSMALNVAIEQAERTSALTFDAVQIRYPGRRALAIAGVSLEATYGTVTAITGPNGSGKSTLVRALLRRVPLIRGRILVDGTPSSDVPLRVAAQRVAVVPQREELTFPLSVQEYVGLGRFPHGGLWGGASTEDTAAVAAAIARTGIEDLALRQTDELSGGEWQRVRIARALAQGGRTIVLDEPTTFLDVGHEMAVFELLAALASAGMAVLLITHQLNLVARFASTVVLLHRGQVAAVGSPSDVMAGPTLERVYEWPLVVGLDPAVGAPMLIPLRSRDVSRFSPGPQA